MQQVGTIQSIWRYPVKGMAGESLSSAYIGLRGVEGDRIWAVQDLARQEIQSCKFRPNLLQCRAMCRVPEDPAEPVMITFPDGEQLPSDSERANQLVSELIGHASRLEKLRLAEDAGFYRRHKKDDHTWLAELKATFEREPGEPLPDLENLPPDAQENVTTPGTFFLVAPFHLLSTATLRHMQALNPESDWDIARFRPNLVVDTSPGMEGLVEQRWLGRSLRIGAGVVDCIDTAPRCGAVVRKQASFGEDKTILRSIVKNADQNLGIYGTITRSTTIKVGDPIYLDDSKK